jgi:hydrogenase nickel incorporation protein HypA/HybF
MHEYSIVASLLERVEIEVRARGATAVHRLHLRIGSLAGVEIDLLTTAYETFRERTICKAAELAVEEVPARWQCPACDRQLGAGEPLQCHDCRRPARLVQGDEIILQRIEMEVD